MPRYAAILTRWLAWSLVLPLAGTMLLGLNPIIGLFIVLAAAYAPTELLSFIYLTGLTPSAITVGVYFRLARRRRVLISVLIACGVAAFTAAAWWAMLSCMLQANRPLDGGMLLYMSVIAAIATALLGFDHRIRWNRNRLTAAGASLPEQNVRY